SWDSPWDMLAMSKYNTITSLTESPLQEGLIYAGTDDGLIQITEDGGTNWRRVEVGSLPDVPKTAFVNDIKADLHDANTVYIALDNHKFGDLNPYLLKSTNRGKSWRSVKGNIPERTLVWRVVQDHVKSDLLFAGTEFGVYFTIDGGERWVKLTGDVPTISFRDLVIQRRENDLVGATFGRGFYVFDDYNVLRNVSEEQLEQEATLFPVRNAWWYIQGPVLGFSEKASQGAAYFTAKNPPFGAVFTYYLAEALKSKKTIREEKEKELIEQDKDVPFLGWDEMESERRQEDPVIWLTVKDTDGNVVRRIEGPTKKGFHRVAWDLRFPTTNAIDTKGDFDGGNQSGVMAAPGDYTVTLSKQIDGTVTPLSDPIPFEVERMRKGALDGSEAKDVAAFWQQLAKLQRSTTATSLVLRNTLTRVDAMRVALSRTPAAPGDLDKQLYELRQTLLALDEQINGNRSKRQVGEIGTPTIGSRLRFAMGGTRLSTYGPTPNLQRSLEIAYSQFAEVQRTLDSILKQQLPDMERALSEAGAPWVEGQPIPK
ncbi:MAG: glycosyl hydrolase, partial [Candidatus Krumholzibacteria bacterium]|nr:glycosyl hydrolase [Candidatus Krumholzibacteria bacterium]